MNDDQQSGQAQAPPLENPESGQLTVPHDQQMPPPLPELPQQPVETPQAAVPQQTSPPELAQPAEQPVAQPEPYTLQQQIPGEPQTQQPPQQFQEQSQQPQPQQPPLPPQPAEYAAPVTEPQYNQPDAGVSPQPIDSQPPLDYMAQAQSAAEGFSNTNPKKILMLGGIFITAVIAIGIIALLTLGPKEKNDTENASTSENQQQSSAEFTDIEELTVKVPASWRQISDKDIGVSVKMPEQTTVDSSGASEIDLNGVTTLTSGYGITNDTGKDPIGVSLLRLDGVKDEQQLKAFADSASSPSNPAAFVYKDIKTNLSKKLINKQTMYVYEFSAVFNQNGLPFKSSTVFLFKDSVCYGVTATTDVEKPDHTKELNYSYTVAATLEKL